MEPENERPILNLEGEKAALGPLRRELLPTLQRWMNDFEMVKTLARTARPVTAEMQAEWLEKMLAPGPTDLVFTIYERRTGGTWRAAGCTGLHEIDHVQGKATFGILLGEPEARGRGIGTEATRLVLDYAFNVLHLHNVLLSVYAFNPAAIRCYEKAGFKLLGRRREARLHLGKRYDEVYMDALASDFTSPLLAKKLAVDAPR